MTETDFEAGYARIYAFVKSRLEAAPGCHDFDHTLRVLRNAEKLAEELPAADLRIVRLAALLHDLARPEEMRAKGKFCHAREGAAAAAAILKKHGFPQKMIEPVCNCIRSHRFRGGELLPSTPEAAIIYDADKLDSIGAIGIGRAFHFAGREQARVHNRLEEALNSPAYSRDDSAYREYLVKLRYVPDKMLTAPGKRYAAARAEFMHNFFLQIEKETDGGKEDRVR
ncbi:MAG: HD domain-containing protein [Victivallaceae bacterium]|nr:HD domain-containing protein [Victivallaceae bacterium]